MNNQNVSRKELKETINNLGLNFKQVINLLSFLTTTDRNFGGYKSELQIMNLAHNDGSMTQKEQLKRIIDELFYIQSINKQL